MYGKCGITLLPNISERYCCQELDGCWESIESDIVRQDLRDGETLKCITEHPEFQPICVEKWSLRLADSITNKKEMNGLWSFVDSFNALLLLPFIQLLLMVIVCIPFAMFPGCSFTSSAVIFLCCGRGEMKEQPPSRGTRTKHEVLRSLTFIAC